MSSTPETADPGSTTTQVAVARPPGPVRRMACWAAGHTIDDFYQGLVPAMVPFMAVERGYSYTAVAALSMSGARAKPSFPPVANQLIVA